MTKRLVGGYAFRQEVNRAVNANRAAREALRRLLDEQPGPHGQAFLLAKVAYALGENLAALREIERIGAGDEAK